MRRVRIEDRVQSNISCCRNSSYTWARSCEGFRFREAGGVLAAHGSAGEAGGVLAAHETAGQAGRQEDLVDHVHHAVRGRHVTKHHTRCVNVRHAVWNMTLSHAKHDVRRAVWNMTSLKANDYVILGKTWRHHRRNLKSSRLKNDVFRIFSYFVIYLPLFGEFRRKPLRFTQSPLV